MRKFLMLAPALISPVLIAAGCASVDDPFLQTGALSSSAPALATSVAPEYAMATIPVAVSSIRQTVASSSVEQTVVYANRTDMAGENTVTVKVGGGSTSTLHAPTQSEVVAEMRTVLPKVRMAISPTIRQNAYGVFGYATGPLGKNGSCLYAWQVARPEGGGFADGKTARIRVRYCDPAMPQERAADLMAGLTVKPVTSRTLQALRHAAGSGQTTAAPLYAGASIEQPSAYIRMPVSEEPAIRPRRRKVEQPVAVETPVEQAAAVETQPAKQEAAAPVISNPVKIPMPGEAAVLAQASDDLPVAKAAAVVTTPTASRAQVPLPGAVAVLAR